MHYSGAVSPCSSYISQFEGELLVIEINVVCLNFLNKSQNNIIVEYAFENNIRIVNKLKLQIFIWSYMTPAWLLVQIKEVMMKNEVR